MRMRALGRIAAATALAAAASLLTASGAQSADYVVRNPGFTAPTVPTATFNDPRIKPPADLAGQQSVSHQKSIKNQLIDLIDHAEPGTAINGSVWTFNDNEAGDAFVAAHKRGVKVRLILDSNALPDKTKDWLDPANLAAVAPESEFKKLAAELGVDRSKDSFVYVCPRQRGCIGARPAEVIGKETINHNKFFVFEKVGTVSNVVFQTSANLTGTQLDQYYNNAVTIPSQPLYAEYEKYFRDLLGASTDALGTAAYDAEGKPVNYGEAPRAAGGYTAYFSPRRESPGTTPGTDPATDPVLDFLKPVTCTAGTTRIRVGMYAFTRTQIADRLVQLRKEGCQVYVFLNDEPGNTGSVVRDKLLAGGLNGVASCVKPSVWDPMEINGVHSKYLLVEGTYEGQADRTVVFTGSQNYTYPSLRGYDETLLRIDDRAVYNAFEHNFDDVLSGLGTKTGICTPMA